MSFRAKENLSKTAHFAFARNPALVLGFHSNRRGHGKLQTDSSLRRPGTPLAAATGHDSSLSNLYPNCQSQQKDANSCCNQNSIHIYLTQNLPELKKGDRRVGHSVTDKLFASNFLPHARECQQFQHSANEVR